MLVQIANVHAMDKKKKKSISIPREHDIGTGQWTPSLFYTKIILDLKNFSGATESYL